eukprot:922147-Amphidinium_carterae.1
MTCPWVGAKLRGVAGKVKICQCTRRQVSQLASVCTRLDMFEPTENFTDASTVPRRMQPRPPPC